VSPALTSSLQRAMVVPVTLSLFRTLTATW
jgi:hypothetical protein